jgi:predicted protein tyrosine phosphatase
MIRELYEEHKKKMEALWSKQVCIFLSDDKSATAKVAKGIAKHGSDLGAIRRWSKSGLGSDGGCRVELVAQRTNHSDAIKGAVKMLTKKGDISPPVREQGRWATVVLLNDRSWNRSRKAMERALKFQGRARHRRQALLDIVDQYWKNGRVTVVDDVATKVITTAVGD